MFKMIFECGLAIVRRKYTNKHIRPDTGQMLNFHTEKERERLHRTHKTQCTMQTTEIKPTNTLFMPGIQPYTINANNIAPARSTDMSGDFDFIVINGIIYTHPTRIVSLTDDSSPHPPKILFKNYQRQIRKA